MYVCMYVYVAYISIYIIIGIRILCCSVFDFKLNGLKYLVKKKKQKKNAYKYLVYSMYRIVSY